MMLTTLRTSFLCPPAPAKIKMQIPVSTFQRRIDSSCENRLSDQFLRFCLYGENRLTLLADAMRDGFNACVLISFTESPCPTMV